MALAGIMNAVSSDAADLFACWDLAQQDWCMADMAPSDLDSSKLQCFLINSEMDLATDQSFRTTVFPGVLFALSFDLDPGAIDKKVQRTLGATVGDVDGQGFLTARHPRSSQCPMRSSASPGA